MRIVASTIQQGSLRIVCAGPFGVGSLGHPSGQLLKQAIEEALDQPGLSLSEVVIDFLEVNYEWGDGPAWSILPAIRRGLKVSYLARGEVRQSLSELFDAAHFPKLGHVTVTEAG